MLQGPLRRTVKGQDGEIERRLEGWVGTEAAGGGEGKAVEPSRDTKDFLHPSAAQGPVSLGLLLLDLVCC